MRLTRSRSILVLDEIDHVAASSRMLASLFTLAQKHYSALRIIGIANTHTLTSSVSPLSLSLDSVTGVSTLHFQPYDPRQLLSILQSWLKPLTSLESPTSEAVFQHFLPVPTLTLFSRKIAAHTGDVCSLFGVLRGAIDLAVTQPPSSDKDTPPITPAHIFAALKAYSPSSKVAPAQSTPAKCSYQQRDCHESPKSRPICEALFACAHLGLPSYRCFSSASLTHSEMSFTVRELSDRDITCLNMRSGTLFMGE
jgi:cell division control protein 6